jgi:hypothetical protein
MQRSTKPGVEKIHHRRLGLDRFELLELRRDDGIQTFHAREVATARPVQVHVFIGGLTPENVSLLELLDRLPGRERRRVIDRGQTDGRPYVVTDRLAGFASLREWVQTKASPKHDALDAQFHQLFIDNEEPTQAFLVKPAINDPLAESAPEASRGSPVLWTILGLVAALVFLGLIIAVFAFRPR